LRPLAGHSKRNADLECSPKTAAQLDTVPRLDFR
jgi:hypothetical protein